MVPLVEELLLVGQGAAMGVTEGDVEMAMGGMGVMGEDAGEEAVEVVVEEEGTDIWRIFIFHTMIFSPSIF